jgi:hypothetical protein
VTGGTVVVSEWPYNNDYYDDPKAMLSSPILTTTELAASRPTRAWCPNIAKPRDLALMRTQTGTYASSSRAQLQGHGDSAIEDATGLPIAAAIADALEGRTP